MKNTSFYVAEKLRLFFSMSFLFDLKVKLACKTATKNEKFCEIWLSLITWFYVRIMATKS